MICTACGVFEGSPLCGACRAAARVTGILQSGRLPRSEQRRVVGLLRGVAGELSDLIEAGLPTGDTPGRGAPGDKGETKGPTPGPGEEKVKKEPLSASQYTYSEGEEEEAITKEEEVEAPGDPPRRLLKSSRLQIETKEEKHP